MLPSPGLFTGWLRSVVFSECRVAPPGIGFRRGAGQSVRGGGSVPPLLLAIIFIIVSFCFLILLAAFAQFSLLLPPNTATTFLFLSLQQVKCHLVVTLDPRYDTHQLQLQKCIKVPKKKIWPLICLNTVHEKEKVWHFLNKKKVIWKSFC